MNKKQFDEMFVECTDSLHSETIENITAKLNKYKTKDDTISATELALFAYSESINYSRKLIYSVLFKVLEIED